MENANRIAQEIHDERRRLSSAVKAWAVLGAFAGVCPAALVTPMQIPLARQTEPVVYVASTAVTHLRTGSSPSTLVVPMQTVLPSIQPKQPTMNVEVGNGNFFSGEMETTLLHPPIMGLHLKGCTF